MKALDLNLLQLLVALERTRHLGRAALSLQMSQSGFSTALAKLRRQLDDELFVRAPGGMRPTPRALLLVETARSVLHQVENVYGTTIFDPKRSDVAYRLSMSDVAEVVFMPGLLAHLASAAPHVTLHIVSPSVAPIAARLAGGEIDLAIGYFPDLDRDAYFRQPLFEHTYACVVRKGHPTALKGLTKSVYEALGHLAIVSSARSSSLLEQALEREGLQRRVVMTSPNHLTLPPVVARTDLVATVPLGTAIDAVRSHGLVALPLPFEPPTFPVYQYWHRRMQREPSHQWLRSQVKNLFNTEHDPYGNERMALYGPSSDFRSEPKRQSAGRDGSGGCVPGSGVSL